MRIITLLDYWRRKKYETYWKRKQALGYNLVVKIGGHHKKHQEHAHHAGNYILISIGGVGLYEKEVFSFTAS